MVLRDHEQVEAMILIHSALSDGKRTVVNSVEAELTHMDLKSITARSLPDPHTLQKSFHLLGSKVLQVQKGPHDVDEENIKMSMFSYEKEDDRDYEGRGRGGRGQERSRGRGRGGFR